MFVGENVSFVIISRKWKTPNVFFNIITKMQKSRFFTTYEFSFCLNDYCLIDIAITSAS